MNIYGGVYIDIDLEMLVPLDSIIDYETFINTSYFAQGRADLFSKKTPAERKKLLGEILGLDSYGELSSESRSEAREKEIQS